MPDRRRQCGQQGPVAVVLDCDGFHDRATEFGCQLVEIYRQTACAGNIHHVHGNHHGNTKLTQLQYQAQIHA